MNDVEKVDPSPEGIANYITKRAHELWSQKSAPFLLANISPELMLRGVNYKEILESGTTLKQFISSLNDLRIVTHPIQKAKIAVVPKDSSFTFYVEPSVGPVAAVEQNPKKSRRHNQRYIVMQFLEALSRLTEEEVKQVNIPVHIIARLMDDR